MSAPVCKLCGHAHWGNEEHVFTEKVTEELTETPVKMDRIEYKKKYRQDNKERHNAYMRDYMRKKRNGRSES